MDPYNAKLPILAVDIIAGMVYTYGATTNNQH